MQRFVLRQNIERFRSRLSTETDPALRFSLQEMLTSNERELALLDANLEGVWSGTRPALHRYSKKDAGLYTNLPEETYRNSDCASLILDPRPGLKVVDLNGACERIVNVGRAGAVGKSFFELFPDNPDCRLSSGISGLYESLCKVAQTHSEDAISLLRYDIRDRTGRFVERYWRILNSPFYDAEGCLVYLMTAWKSRAGSAGAA